jgi:cellulose synthase/poly-beta-1,6-N-acetylglucosamine synthase-like glycosyltransferase
VEVRGRQSETEPLAKKDRPPFISVVITVLNAEATIRRCIQSILGVDYPRDAFEVIVVDGGSKDSTLPKLSAFPSVKILQEPRVTIGSGRNIGIRQAKGEIIAITDGDVVVDRRWLMEIAHEFEHSNVEGVGGPIRADPNSSRFSRFVGLLPEESLSGVSYGRVPHDMLYTRNAAYRSSVLIGVGLFNESLVAAEDTELNWRIESAGYGLIFSPRIIVYHSHRSTLSSFIKQRFRNGVGCGQLAKVNPRVRHTRLRLVSTAGFVSGLCLLIAFALSRFSLFIYPLTAMILGYVLYCVTHVASVYRCTRSVKAVVVAFLLTMAFPPFWWLGILYGLSRPTTGSN